MESLKPHRSGYRLVNERLSVGSLTGEGAGVDVCTVVVGAIDGVMGDGVLGGSVDDTGEGGSGGVALEQPHITSIFTPSMPECKSHI